MSKETKGVDLAEIQEKLQGQSGKQLWRSLDELTGSPEVEKWLDDEFPYRASLPEVDRRDFLRYMGASLILGGLTLSGCRNLPQEKLVPFVKAPEGYVPGEVKQYATAFTHGGYAMGVLAKVFEGRPIKIEGNPAHPASRGATDVFAQASILGLYDPDRARNVTHYGQVSTWEEFYKELRGVLTSLKAKRGVGLHILSDSDAVNSPTLIWQIGQLKAAFPGMVWHTYDSVRSTPIAAQYRFDRANVVVSLDADFLQGMPGSVRYAHDFIQRRKIQGKDAQVGRLYAAECTPGLVGAMADHRLALKPSEVLNFTLALAGALGLPVAQVTTKPEWSKWIRAVAKDLLANRGAGLVVPGDQQPYPVHLLARAINEKLGSGELAQYNAEPNLALLGSVASVENGLEGLSKVPSIEALLILGGNPAYDATGDIKLAEILKRAKFKARYGLYEDETSELCDWHLPATHFLEHWSDARSYDGVFSIVQPATQPLFEGRSPHELLSAMLGQEQSGYEIVRGYWKGRLMGADQDKAWRMTLDSGVVPYQTTEFTPGVLPPDIAALLPRIQPTKAEGIEIALRPDSTVWDGRYANLGWLQELPKTLTKLTWDNAALMSPETAKKLGLEQEDQVEIEANGAKVLAPVWLLPGQPDEVITLHLGYGRTKAGRVGTGLGFDAGKLRTFRSPHYATGVKVRGTGKKWPEGLASTQNHHGMEGRDIVRYGTIAEFQKNPSLRPEHSHGEKPGEELPNLYDPKEHAYDGYQWGMTIDLDRCTGCGVCVIACQAENNIPVVGKSQIQRGRAMHWIRVDRYYGPRDGKGSLENPSTLFQPLTCMHCEQAPCEPVCPVAATVHSKEGLNQMVYNRCVGTRYCSNNCPYKVRRFNFLNYTDNMTQFAENKDRPLLKMLNNPDVTVRGRGVMEKCTYCVQRINHARIESKKQGRQIKDGEIVTACQGACPTRAIEFGNIADPNSRVSKLKKQERNYGLLTELNTRPRTSYLARLTNPNPELTEA